MNSERLLTKIDVRERLQVSPRTLDRLVAEGKLEKVKLGRLTRFRESDVRKLIEGL